MDPTRVMAVWSRLGGSALGRRLFSMMLGWGVPYSRFDWRKGHAACTGNLRTRAARSASGAQSPELYSRDSLDQFGGACQWSRDAVGIAAYCQGDRDTY